MIYFLRTVIWTVPGFPVERYRERLRKLHEHIQANRAFITHSSRVFRRP